MELDRLNPVEIMAVAEIIKMLGHNDDVELLGRNIRICEATAQVYRRILHQIRSGNDT